MKQIATLALRLRAIIANGITGLAWGGPTTLGLTGAVAWFSLTPKHPIGAPLWGTMTVILLVGYWALLGKAYRTLEISGRLSLIAISLILGIIASALALVGTWLNKNNVFFSVVLGHLLGLLVCTPAILTCCYFEERAEKRAYEAKAQKKEQQRRFAAKELALVFQGLSFQDQCVIYKMAQPIGTIPDADELARLRAAREAFNLGRRA